MIPPWTSTRPIISLTRRSWTDLRYPCGPVPDKKLSDWKRVDRSSTLSWTGTRQKTKSLGEGGPVLNTIVDRYLSRNHLTGTRWTGLRYHRGPVPVRFIFLWRRVDQSAEVSGTGPSHPGIENLEFNVFEHGNGYG